MRRPRAARGPCASLRRPDAWAAGLIQRCWRLGAAAVCCAPAHLCAEGLRFVSVTAAAGDYGRWFAFLSLLLCLLYFIPPGELALPLSTILLVMTASYQFTDMRESQGGAMLSAAIAIYLAFQHFDGVGSLRNAFRRASIIATVSIICVTIVTLMLAF